MLEDFNSAFSDFMGNRTINVGREIVKNNPEYSSYRDKVMELHEKIRSLLPDDSKHLIKEYEEFGSAQFAILIDTAYEQGLKDGVVLIRFLGLSAASAF